MNTQHFERVREDLERYHTCTAKNAECGDRLLVAEAKSGRTSAFGALYERHRSKIYRIAFRILRNQQDAEDAVQRSFQRGFTNLMRFREDASFSTWMTRIAINEALMLLRQRHRNGEARDRDYDDTGVLPSLDLPDERPTPEQAMARTELQNVVIHAVSKLRRNLRVVVLLREVHGLTSAETARRLGLSVGTVKARIFHARRHLRRHLERKLEGTPITLLGARN